VPLTLVQTTDSSGIPAQVTYQFSNKSGTKKSSVIQVVGNLTSKSTTITFTDVPQGTASDPIYLIIVNKVSLPIRGNGYTSF
jgi:hypothetical protein